MKRSQLKRKTALRAKAAPKAKPRKRIRATRKRFHPKFWPDLSFLIREAQQGYCAWTMTKVPRLECAHLVGLGEGMSRNNPKARRKWMGEWVMLNDVDNLAGLSRASHALLDSVPTETRVAMIERIKKNRAFIYAHFGTGVAA